MPINKVLVVDDSKTEVMFLTDLLTKNGFNVRSAGDADEAFKRLERAVSLLPTNMRALAALGDYYLSQEDPEISPASA